MPKIKLYGISARVIKPENRMYVVEFFNGCEFNGNPFYSTDSTSRRNRPIRLDAVATARSFGSLEFEPDFLFASYRRRGSVENSTGPMQTCKHEIELGNLVASLASDYGPIVVQPLADDVLYFLRVRSPSGNVLKTLKQEIDKGWNLEGK